MNENYANLARFKLVVNALPLPITDITPADPLKTVNGNPDFFRRGQASV